MIESERRGGQDRERTEAQEVGGCYLVRLSKWRRGHELRRWVAFKSRKATSDSSNIFQKEHSPVNNWNKITNVYFKPLIVTDTIGTDVRTLTPLSGVAAGFSVIKLLRMLIPYWHLQGVAFCFVSFFNTLIL